MPLGPGIAADAAAETISEQAGRLSIQTEQDKLNAGVEAAEAVYTHSQSGTWRGQ